MKLTSPHKFKESILLFGGGGAGKTTAVLSIARAVEGKVWVIDNDISFAYERALATDFSDLDNVEVVEVDAEWEECVDALERVIEEADPERDWIVFDPFSETWSYVQDWMSSQVHGADIAGHMVKLRSESDDIKAFNKELSEAMNWPIINRTYTAKMYRNLRRWKGHLILVAEAAQTTRNDDEEARELFGGLGLKPAGQKRMHHVCSTNILITKHGHGVHKMTTAKDRNREEQEKVEFSDFGVDYLFGVAGWERV